MRNLKIEDLHPAAHLVTGTADAREYCQLEGADFGSFDAALFIGYHAMAKTAKAIHPHTIAGAVVHELRVNGKAHGETGLNALVLSSFGIPVVLVTGDETTCGEAKSMLGAIETVAVKSAVGRNAALCRPPAATRPEITAAARRALERDLKSAPLYKLDAPMDIEVDFLTMVQCNRAIRTRGVEQRGAVTIGVTGSDPWDAYRNLWAALRSALYEPASFLA
jgi:D-amino peptidase